MLRVLKLEALCVQSRDGSGNLGFPGLVARVVFS